ncbi:ADP-ribosylglycohydrolase family protein [Butyrivibrio sp. JL13D10]|uniref:ADP-ribosylglycohydrolase family protein n=1 Tax=Butyrivibrio sp. JL13D10 TaxID=3236815 RepID=UPI0038B6AB0F
MIGAIIGDVSGSRYERLNHKSKEFELLDKRCHPTDDTIMSLAVAKAILECEGNWEELSEKAVSAMKELGRAYKNAGYGKSFIGWLSEENPKPYDSYGNGAAMRVGPCGFAASNIPEVKELSAAVTKVSHNHPEGMKGAEATAIAVFMAKSGRSKDEIRGYIEEYYYKIDFTLDQIRASYKFDSSCQGSVPVALEAFFEASDFEDAIRNAISVGGDSDTIATIAGVIAEAFYGIPEGIIEATTDYLDSRQMEILYYYEKMYPSKALDSDGKATRTVFEVIDDCVDKVIPAGTSITAECDENGNIIHAQVDESVMKPDFSSFDKRDIGKEAIEILSKASSDLTRAGKKAGKKAGKGILTAAKSMKDTIDKTKEMAAAKAVNCYAIATENTEDTESTMYAVSVLQKAGFDAKIHVAQGTMFGYVFAKGEDYEKVAKLLEDVKGVALNANPVDKVMAEMIRKH